ncbi:DUF551 domain-containing protein [Yersinia enterocolitica]
MKELDSFTVERLGEIKNAFLDCHKETAPNIGEIFALIDIALAAKRAEPVGYLEQNCLDYLRSGSDADIWPDGGAGDIPVYLTPQLNSQVPLGSWIKCSDQMPEDDEYYLTHSTAGVDVTIFHDGRFQDEYATHWMPLPAAPEKSL